MAKKICFFNHKGGVSKTTSVFHIGWKLAEQGKKVLLVDADSQCNLSSIFLHDNFWNYYIDGATKQNNIKDGVSNMFTGVPEPIRAIECPRHQRQQNLFLLPGHMNIAEYEPQITYAISAPNAFLALRNQAGAFNALIDMIESSYGIDYVLIDMNPGLSSINKVLFVSSDAFVIPTNPDMFCQMALESLAKILPSWVEWKSNNMVYFQEATYPLPTCTPKMIGTIIQRFNIKYGKAAASFQTMIGGVKDIIDTNLKPALDSKNMLFAPDDYTNAGILQGMCLEEIPDFQSLGQRYQDHGVPVFALNEDEMVISSVPLSQGIKDKKADIDRLFTSVASKINSIMS